MQTSGQKDLKFSSALLSGKKGGLELTFYFIEDFSIGHDAKFQR